MHEGSPIKKIRYVVALMCAAEGLRLLVRSWDTVKVHWAAGAFVLLLATVFLTASYGAFRSRRWSPAYATVAAGFFSISAYANHLEEGPLWATFLYFTALLVVLIWLIGVCVSKFSQEGARLT